jgi:hypothetical protein
MVTVLREFVTYHDDGRVEWLEECESETDTTSTQQANSRRHYFRQPTAGLHGEVEQIELGVFRLNDGSVVRERNG